MQVQCFCVKTWLSMVVLVIESIGVLCTFSHKMSLRKCQDYDHLAHSNQVCMDFVNPSVKNLHLQIPLLAVVEGNK